jgi:mannan endo-1,4-beta-mannosidase
VALAYSLQVRSRGPVSAVVVVIGLALTACSTYGPPPQPQAQPAPVFARQSVDSFVTASGRDFQVDGKPFRFVGVNIYDAAATDRYSCNPALRMSETELRDTLATLHDRYGATVLRFWAYQTYTASGQDFSGIDQVVRAAKAVGMRVLPALEDGPGDCTTSDRREPKYDHEGDTWFTDGYKEPYGEAALSFRDYVGVVAEHYRDEPAILGWSLVNEAETNARDGEGRSALVGFARDVGAVVRAADPHHLITLGTQSNGAPGASGPDFTAVYSVPELDFAEVHDWEPYGGRDEPMPGGIDETPPAADDPACTQSDAKIGCSFALSVGLDKPLFVGEAGIDAKTPSERRTRAAQLGAKMRAAVDAGAAGYLLWRVTKSYGDVNDILLADQDPVLDRMASVAAALRGS